MNNVYIPVFVPGAVKPICIAIILVSILLVPAATADARDPVQLTDAHIEGTCLYPSWSPDGAKIAYQGNSSLWIMHRDGSIKTRLPVDSPVVYPAWSPTGDVIAFSQGSGEDRDVWTIRSDGTRVTPLTDSPYEDYFISWSPDGTKIAFFSNRTGSREIWVMDADGGNQHSIFDGEVRDYQLEDTIDVRISWSPSGDQIAIPSFADGRSDIWIVDVAGGKQTPLFLEWAFNPKWSPDGSEIAYFSLDVWAIHPDGSGNRRLTDDECSGGIALEWSPSGSKIAYSSVPDVEVRNRDGSAQQIVKTHDSPMSRELHWSPAGDTIAMSDGREIFLIELDEQARDDVVLAVEDGKTSQMPGFVSISSVFALVLAWCCIFFRKR
jgi:Tol biopolymer transport system component